jgi:DeoR family fructose operon transcriptional repressor
MLSKLHVDRTFIAANGVSTKTGLSTPNMDVGNIKSVLVGFADEVVLLSDSSKIGHNSFVSFAPIHEIDVLITDSLADPAFIEEVRNMNITVDIA